MAGHPFPQIQKGQPGLANYITTLEVGYALHELTFAAMFLTIVLIPLRRGYRWAWWASWALIIASLGYTLTFGQHDPQILRRSLAIDVAVVALLLVDAKQSLVPGTRHLSHPEATSSRHGGAERS